MFDVSGICCQRATDDRQAVNPPHTHDAATPRMCIILARYICSNSHRDAAGALGSTDSAAATEVGMPERRSQLQQANRRNTVELRTSPLYLLASSCSPGKY